MAEEPEDLNLPNSVVIRIMKEALPDGVNVSKKCRLAIARAASVFVLYATSSANNFAMQNKRKTISGNDVLDAMREMEFEHFVEPLKKTLTLYRAEQGAKKKASEGKKKAKQQSETKLSTEMDEKAKSQPESATDPMETEDSD